MAETPLRIRFEGVLPSFDARARYVWETFAEALGRCAEFVEHGLADITYTTSQPHAGDALWVPAQRDAQRFFDGRQPFPAERTFSQNGLTLLFPPVERGGPVPGDIVASAFYLLSRWDERTVPTRDQFDRFPLAASAFRNVQGLELGVPAVESYIAALRRALGIAEPSSWSVYLTHDIDRIRRRTPQGVGSLLKRRNARGLLDLVGKDPWRNIPQLLWSTTRRGLAPTVFLIGRNRHRLDGTPRKVYDRERAAMARAVSAAGGEVGLHAAFASSESASELGAELQSLRDETGLPIRGVRFHYLRFRYHETVEWLERAGVAYDSSLGFSEAPGYACGIARPFRPWLFSQERPADLRLVPLAVMDTTLHSHLALSAEAARSKAREVLSHTRDAGGAVSLLWHNTFLADSRAPDYGQLWDDLLEDLQADGASCGPICPPADAATGDDALDGRRIVHLTSVHRPRDVRILHKEVTALRRAGADARVLGLAAPAPRARRPAAGWRLAHEGLARNADAYHVHDPELLPAAWWLAKRSGRPVIYDVHEYLGETARTKRWIPRPLRRATAVVAERAEQALASRLAGVIAVNEDLAARFAMGGAPEVATVTNAPWRTHFGDPAPQVLEPIIVYIGGIGPQRGIAVMREAFSKLSTPGARLLLAGPGDPGDLPPAAEHLGTIDHSEVPGLLARAAVVWIPLQQHGNYDRAVPTKLTEAMAAGRPVVASALRRMGGIVRAADCGILVPPADAEAHARALDELLGDTERAGRLGASGRAAFEAGLGFETQARRLSSFYARILAR